jgi:hypothetical protein
MRRCQAAESSLFAKLAIFSPTGVNILDELVEFLITLPQIGALAEDVFQSSWFCSLLRRKLFSSGRQAVPKVRRIVLK